MGTKLLSRGGRALGFFAVVALVVGCTQSSSAPAEAKKGGDRTGQEVAERGKTDADAPGKEAKKPHDHSGWWCNEHGIPEEECSMCAPKVAKEFKAKGDWCDKHDRAKSQCFICDPSLKEKFAAKYRAKYGKEPPPIEEEKDEKKGEVKAKEDENEG